jgi:hypothetical protein
MLCKLRHVINCLDLNVCKHSVFNSKVMHGSAISRQCEGRSWAGPALVFSHLDLSSYLQSQRYGMVLAFWVLIHAC